MKVISQSAHFSHHHFARSSVAHRFLSVRGALALSGLLDSQPVCSTDAIGCFHQLQRRGSSPSRLHLADAFLGQCQFLFETLE